MQPWASVSNNFCRFLVATAEVMQKYNILSIVKLQIVKEIHFRDVSEAESTDTIAAYGNDMENGQMMICTGPIQDVSKNKIFQFK